MDANQHIAAAESWVEQERYRLAIEHYQHALTLLENSVAEAPLEQRGHCYQEIGNLWRLQGDNKKTGQYFQLALKEFSELYGDTPHIHVATALFLLGSFLEQIWKLAPALDYYERALLQLEALLGAEHAHTVATKQAILRVKEKFPA